jgi:hypothetical protein
MDNDVFVRHVRFCRRLIASREIGEGVGPLEFGARLRGPVPIAAMARDATILIKNFAVLYVGRL